MVSLRFGASRVDSDRVLDRVSARASDRWGSRIRGRQCTSFDASVDAAVGGCYAPAMRSDGLERLVDAAGNRAREGLRVLEDLARFVLDDGSLASGLKDARHAVTSAVRGLPLDPLVGRDAAGDVGGSLGTSAEYDRPGIAAVAEAAGGRTTEALRSLEELAKVVDPDGGTAARIESIRYASYDLVARLVERLARGGPAGWRVQVLLTESACRRPWRETLEAIVAGGADAIQVREKDLDPAALIERTRAVLEVARPAGVSVVVNDRADVAAAAGADGVHLGQDDLPFEEARRVVGPLSLVGGSSHDLDEAARVVAAGCDYAGIGRFAESRTKDGAAMGGPDYVRAFVEAHPRLPHLVIGGVDLENLPAIIAAGGRGVAVCAAVCDAEDPSDVVARMRLALSEAVANDAAAAGSAG